MFQILEFIKFLFKSTNQHGVHSPFVYDVVTKCFYNSTNHNSYIELSKYRNALLKNEKTIEITDLGSGSRVFKSNKRLIKSIAKRSGTTRKRAQLLLRMVNYFNSKHILELGTSLGIGTHALALGNKSSQLISIEGCPNLSKFTRQQLSVFNIKNVVIKTGDITNILADLKSTKQDLVFLDANHNKEATLEYFNKLIKTAHNNSIFIFDDIHWSKDMLDAWEIIKSHPEVTVTIDTFFWGIVFFRKEQAKENFIIRL